MSSALNTLARTAPRGLRLARNQNYWRFNLQATTSYEQWISSYQGRDNEKDYSRYNCIRPFSVSVDEPPSTMRERAVSKAREGVERARHASKEGAKHGAKLAKKGALTSYEKLKQYGPVFVGTYFSLYVVTLGSLFGGIDSGLIDPVTIMEHINGGDMEESKSTASYVIDYLNHYSLTRPAVPFLEKNPHFANLAVAWVATKFTEPARLVVAMAVVPRLAKYLGFTPHKITEGENEEVVHSEPESTKDQIKK